MAARRRHSRRHPHHGRRVDPPVLRFDDRQSDRSRPRPCDRARAAARRARRHADRGDRDQSEVPAAHPRRSRIPRRRGRHGSAPPHAGTRKGSRLMAKVELVETSLRDGNQCLWGALGVDTARTLTIAPAMERAGFKAIDFTTSTHMGVAVRYKQEDPWERIRQTAAAMPNTPLQFLSTGFRFIAWETASPEFMALAYRTLVKNGMRRFALADPINDIPVILAGARMAKAGGADYVVGALVFTVSPIHDDDHYAACARALAASPDVDALSIKAPGGLLTPTRARTLIPAVMAEIGDKPLELHAHCTIGLATTRSTGGL